MLPQRWQRYVSPGVPGRQTTQRELRTIYSTWLFALVLKLLGSSWDVAWHFRFLRDDLAPPHNINTAGTIFVVALVLFHTWTGLGVDRRSLRWMQAGIGTFLIAIPLDLINHRLFGLDITAWSPTHMLLYIGTGIMLVGVLMAWYTHLEPSAFRSGWGIVLWTLLLEDIIFPLSQHEYGVLSLLALRNGMPTADSELLAVAAASGGDPTRFVLPVPMWVYPAWLVIVGTLLLLVARLSTGWRWTATAMAVGYVGYRLIVFHVMQAAGFPPSAFPILLIGAGVLVDLAVQWNWRPWIATLAVIGFYYGAAWLTKSVITMPDFALATAPLVGACLWLGWAGVRWAEHSPVIARWRLPA